MRYIDLGSEYAIDAASHGQRAIGEAWDAATCKTKFSHLYARKIQHEGWNDAKFLKLRVFSAAFMDAMWKTSAFGLAAQQLISVANLLLPKGKWLNNIECVLPYGKVMGQGTFMWYPGNDSTQISMDSPGWLGGLSRPTGVNVPIRASFVSPTYGQSSFVAAYHESFEFENVRLTGDAPGWMDPSYRAYGLYVYDSGETGVVRKVYAEHFNTAGFAFERGTPATADLLTVFNCNFTGIHLLGTALATLNFGTVSSDDCPSLFDMEAYNGREAGGVLNVSCTKQETGVTSEERGPWKGSIVANLRGQFAANFGAISYACAAVSTNTMFFVDPRLVSGVMQNSVLNVGAAKGFNYDLTVQDAANKKGWRGPGSYSGMQLFYSAAGGGYCEINRKAATQITVNSPSRLGFFRGVGTFDYVNGTPAYSFTGTGSTSGGGGTAPTASWVLGTPGAWSSCVAGSQTRSTPYVSSVQGVTPASPKPADVVETQSCTVNPPSGATSQTINSATSATKVLCSLPSVRKITFTGLRITAGTSLSAFAGYLCDKAYVGFGGLYYDNPGQTLVRSVVAGTSYNVTLTFASPVSMKYAVGSDLATVPFTATRVLLEA